MQSALLAGATAAAAVTAACLYTRRMDSKRSQSLKMCTPPPGLGASYFLSGVMGGSGAAKSNTGNLAGVAVVPKTTVRSCACHIGSRSICNNN